jgi:hypothetical protein
MKNQYLFPVMAILAIFTLGCSKEDDTDKLPGKKDIYTFIQKDPVSMETGVRQNNTFEVKELELDRAVLEEAFGGVIPPDLMFYALDSNGTKHVGEDAYTSEFGFYFTGSGNVCTPSTEGCAYFIEYYGFREGNDNPVIGLG